MTGASPCEGGSCEWKGIGEPFVAIRGMFDQSLKSYANSLSLLTE